MSVPLFGRQWSLTVSQRNRPQALQYTSSVTRGEPLRINFSIERTLHSESNKAKFSLVNLSREHRSLITPGSTVVFRAGYAQNYDIVYRGTVALVESNSSGTDVTTDISAGDGEPFLQSANVHLSYRHTTTLAQVLQDICQFLNVTVAGQVYTYSNHIVQRIPRISIPRRVFSGPAKQVLDDLLHPLKITWSIQCGTLLIQNAEGVVNLNAQVLSPQTGLLGMPTKTNTTTKIKTLLLPTIAPGLAVTIKTSNTLVNGNLRVVSAKYQGDTHGAEWSVEAECQPLTYPMAYYIKETSQGAFEDAQQTEVDPSAAEDEAIE